MGLNEEDGWDSDNGENRDVSISVQSASGWVLKSKVYDWTEQDVRSHSASQGSY